MDTLENLIRIVFGSHHQDLSALQMMVRAIITFLFALLIIRLAGIRSFGSQSAFDIVLSITVGAVLSRCITGKYPYFACLGAAAILAVMHRVFAMISCKSKWWSKLIKGDADIIYENGVLHKEKMKLHNISKEDLEQAMRKIGLVSFDQVEKAVFETDGKISVIPIQKLYTINAEG